MKTARALTLKSFALAAALLAAPSVSHAELFTYDYQGLGFDLVTPPYTTTDSVSGSFTVDLPTNLGISPLTDVIDYLDSFSFSDGVQTISSAGNIMIFGFDIATDGTGAITDWFISLLDDDTGGLIISGGAGDAGSIDFNFGLNFAPGTFTQAPEPSSLALFAIALGGLGFAARRRKA